MKKTKSTVAVIISSLAALTLTGCVATWTPPTFTVNGPPVVVAPPVVEVDPVGVSLVPETYVWDGFEFVGVVNGGYVYLGPGGVWINCEPWRLNRFHGWERGHGDWRSHPEHFGGGRGGHPGVVGHGPRR